MGTYLLDFAGSPRRGISRPGFTLIELLVVIAIVSILAGLLLGTLGKAKDRACMATDLNNTRQMMLATQMYAGDNGDFFPSPGYIKLPGPCWVYGYPFPFSNGTQQGYDLVYQDQVAAVAQGQLYPYFKEPKLLMCPQDRLNALFVQRVMYVTSYVWNGAINAYDVKTNATLKLGQFKPSSILQWEGDETRPQSLNNGVDFPYEGFTRRHGGGGGDRTNEASAMVTMGRMDGSASRMAAVVLYQLAHGWGVYPNGPLPKTNDAPTDLWCNPLAQNGGPSPFWWDPHNAPSAQ